MSESLVMKSLEALIMGLSSFKSITSPSTKFLQKSGTQMLMEVRGARMNHHQKLFVMYFLRKGCTGVLMHLHSPTSDRNELKDELRQSLWFQTDKTR